MSSQHTATNHKDDFCVYILFSSHVFMFMPTKCTPKSKRHTHIFASKPNSLHIVHQISQHPNNASTRPTRCQIYTIQRKHIVVKCNQRFVHNTIKIHAFHNQEQAPRMQRKKIHTTRCAQFQFIFCFACGCY